MEVPTLAPRFEVRPKIARNAVLLATGCAIFTLIGCWLMVTTLLEGKPENLLAGLLSVLFFGGGGVIAVPRMLKRPVSMVLTGDALEQITQWGSAMIPWDDVEQVGIARQYGNKFVGIRLRNYDRYLASLSPSTAEAFNKYRPYTKGFVRATTSLDVPKVVELSSKFRGYGDPQEALKNFGQVGTLVEGLLWVRETTGYDLLFAWSDLDRPAQQFIALLEQYRRANRTQ